MSSNGKHVPPRERHQRRARTILIVIVAVAVTFGAGFILARTFEANDPTVANAPTSPPASPTGAGNPSVSETPAPPASEAELEDGQHFIQATAVASLEDGSTELTFDLGIFYEGAEAFEFAEENDIELQNDYYIDNDNPKLRTMPIDADAAIEYIPSGTCCELQPGDLDAFAESVNGSDQTDYPDPATTWWWATVSDGVITGLVQQYLP